MKNISLVARHKGTSIDVGRLKIKSSHPPEQHDPVKGYRAYQLPTRIMTVILILA